MSRTRRSAYGVGADLVFQIAFLTTGFLTTPWILRWLGDERYGAYRTLLDWFSVLGALEWGLGGALMASLAMSIARNEEQRVRSLLRAGINAYVMRALWMLAAGAVLIAASPHLLGSSALDAAEIRWASAISALTLLLTPLLLFRALAEARQLHYRVTLAMLVQTLVLNGAWLAAAWAGWGLTGQAWGFVVAQVCAFLCLGVGAFAEVAAASRAPADRAETRSLRNLSWPVLIHALIDRGVLASGTLMIAWLIGPTAVVPFFLTQRLASVVLAQLKAIGDSSWAALVELRLGDESSAATSRLIELTGAVSGIAMSVLAALVAYNHHFVSRWVGESMYAGDAVTILGAVDAWCLALYGLWITPVFGLGELRRWLPWGIAFGTVVAVSGLGFTLQLGLVGPLMGIAIGFCAVVSWALPALLRQLIEASPGALWTAALKPFRWGVPYVAILVFVSRARTPHGWTGLGVEAACAMMGGLALWWCLNLDREARVRWRARLREVVA